MRRSRKPNNIWRQLRKHTCRYAERIPEGFPGSVHDARVLQHSTLYQEAAFLPRGFMILGDGGYPCIAHPIAVIISFKKPVGGEERVTFNRHHAKACSVIEHAFGMLKSSGGPSCCMPSKYPQFVPQVIVSCVTLHNICMGAGDLVQSEEEANGEEEEDGQEKEITDLVSGHRLREQLCTAIAGTEGPGTERV
ncbi:hypothetical protein MHYP_G00351510 [Metynnis hypsauchen]